MPSTRRSPPATTTPGPTPSPAACSVAHPPPLLLTSTKSAEIIKHASNAFLALKISFINAVSNLCEATDANVEQVARGMGLDGRIGPRFLRPGIGYGGSCFPKDVAAFRSVADQLGIDFSLLTEVEKINAQQKKRFLTKVRSALWTLRGKRVAVLGLAFKGETDDIRESPASRDGRDAARRRMHHCRLRSGGHEARRGGASSRPEPDATPTTPMPPPGMQTH